MPGYSVIANDSIQTLGTFILFKNKNHLMIVVLITSSDKDEMLIIGSASAIMIKKTINSFSMGMVYSYDGDNKFLMASFNSSYSDL